MLFQVGGQGTRPTFFEMAAAQQLPASLRAALTYSIGVLALRTPFLHRVLDYEDEFFALLMLVLESHSLRTTDASFAESLYGLRRRAVKIRVKKDNIRLDSGDGIRHSGLEKHQKVLSVVFLVVLPYFKSKLHSVYNKEREARLQASLWGNGGERFDDPDYFDGGGDTLVPTGALDAEASVRTRLAKRIQKTIGACYPWLHAGSEGLLFAYQLLYLLDATGFYSLGLHALGIHVCRATGQELMDTSSRISKIRSHERDRLRGPPWLKTVQGALLNATYTMLDYAQTGLIAAVFFFKMMEWWYQSAEERMSAPTVYPPPPPPPRPKVAKEGIPLPPDRTICHGAVIAVMVVVAMVQLMAKPSEAVTCGQVDTCLVSCIPYLTLRGDPSAACCDGAKALKALTPTTADRKAACACVKDAASRYPSIKDDAATALPIKCGVQINIPISRNTNCGS